LNCHYRRLTHTRDLHNTHNIIIILVLHKSVVVNYFFNVIQSCCVLLTEIIVPWILCLDLFEYSRQFFTPHIFHISLQYTTLLVEFVLFSVHLKSRIYYIVRINRLMIVVPQSTVTYLCIFFSYLGLTEYSSSVFYLPCDLYLCCDLPDHIISLIFVFYHYL